MSYIEINNNLVETFVSFKVSKLLKNIGFDCKCQKYYYHGIFIDIPNESLVDEEFINTYNVSQTTTKAPTQSMAVEWLRVNFNISIWAKYEVIDDSEIAYVWYIKTYIPNRKNRAKDVCDFYDTFSSFDDEMQDWFKTPQQALESALIYAIKKVFNL